MTNTNTNTMSRKRFWFTTFKRLGLIVAVLVALSLNQQAYDHGLADAGHGTVAPAGQVQEDEPSWDCRTMGNQVCGIGAQVDGQPVPAGDYSYGDTVAAPVGDCLEALGYSAGPVAHGDSEACAAAPEVVLGDLTDAEWDCFAQLGYDTSADIPQVAPQDLATCRASARAVFAMKAPAVAVAAAAATPAAQPSSAATSAEQPAEDSPTFDCRTNGNRTCGPDNADGVTPGCYVDGQLAEPWSADMYGRWSNCGPTTSYDREQQDKLDGKVAQVCAPNEQGGVTCDWAE